MKADIRTEGVTSAWVEGGETKMKIVDMAKSMADQNLLGTITVFIF